MPIGGALDGEMVYVEDFDVFVQQAVALFQRDPVASSSLSFHLSSHRLVSSAR